MATRTCHRAYIVILPALTFISVFAGVSLQTSTAAQQSPPAIPIETPGQRLERLANELAARHERELQAGLIDAATRSGKELEELARTQTEKCERAWQITNWARIAPRLNSRQKDELKAAKKLEDQCLWRPGAGDGDPKRIREVESAKRALAISEALTARAPLFAEPAIITVADADVPHPGVMAMAEMLGAPDEQKKALFGSFEEIGLTSRGTPKEFAALKLAIERFLSIAQRSPSMPGAVLAFEMLRRTEESRDDIPAAMGYVRAHIDLLEKRFGPDSPSLCHVLWPAAALLMSSKESEKSIEAAARCLKLVAARGDSSLMHASALNNLGVMYHRNGTLAEAVSAYAKSLAMFERSPSTLGDVAAAREEPRVRLHANLGLAYWQLGDLSRASSHLVTARVQMNQEGGQLSTEKGVVDSMAELAAELDVVLTLERALTLSSVQPPSIGLPMLLERKGLALEAKSTAVRVMTGSPERLDEYRALLAARSALAHPKRAAGAAEYGSREKAAELDVQILTLEAGARQQLQSTALSATAASPDPREKAYNDALQKAFAKRMEKVIKSLRDDANNGVQFGAMVEARRQAEIEIAPKFKDYLEARQKRERGARESLLERVQAGLPEKAVLLEMVRFRPFVIRALSEANRWEPARYGVYVLLPTGTPGFFDFGDAAPIDDLVVEFRRALAQPRGTLAHDLGRRLEEVLIAPLRHQLRSITDVYVSPDGLLNLVPFGALVDEGDRYLIETLTFNYLSSGRDLTRESSAQPTRLGNAVVVADPAFDSKLPAPPLALDAGRDGPALRRSLDGRFEPLPGTGAEAQTVKSVFSDAVIHTGAAATEGALKAVSKPRLLHLATHGFFLEDQDIAMTRQHAERPQTAEDPMVRSGLVFAGANNRESGADDGVLTALEAASLDLSGTQLVVLSACDTGVGDVKTGEGVFGLRRAFIAAGAETLVLSLWQVEDTATQRLMTEFYHRLAKGEGRSEALRQASLSLLRNPSYRHPFFWASFISTGATGRMR